MLEEPCPGGCGTDLAPLKASGSLRSTALTCSDACRKRFQRGQGFPPSQRPERPDRTRTGARPPTSYVVFRKTNGLLTRIREVRANKAAAAIRQVAHGAEPDQFVAIPSRYLPGVEVVNLG